MEHSLIGKFKLVLLINKLPAFYGTQNQLP